MSRLGEWGSAHDRAELDRHITGNYGEDQFMDDDDLAEAVDARREERHEQRMEAKYDAAMEELERNGWRCQECGELWDPGRRPATRTDPAYVEQEECPRCGGPPVGY